MAKKKTNTKKKEKTRAKEAANASEEPRDQKVQQEENQAEDTTESSNDDLQSRVNEINDKYLRLYSEFDNYRRRTIKEKLDLSKTASEEVIVELLPILDDFERAIKSSKENESCNAITEGMELIFNKLFSSLQKKGLMPVEAHEKDFDTDFHEAVTYIPAPTNELKGKVVDVIEKGYLLNEKVIRYAKVVIGQ